MTAKAVTASAESLVDFQGCMSTFGACSIAALRDTIRRAMALSGSQSASTRALSQTPWPQNSSGTLPYTSIWQYTDPSTDCPSFLSLSLPSLGAAADDEVSLLPGAPFASAQPSCYTVLLGRARRDPTADPPHLTRYVLPNSTSAWAAGTLTPRLLSVSGPLSLSLSFCTSFLGTPVPECSPAGWACSCTLSGPARPR